MRAFVFALLALCASEVAAQSTYTLEPAQARAGDAVTLRIDNPAGCILVSPFGINVSRTGDVIAVEMQQTDTVPCPPEWATPRFVALGTFESGNYQVEVTTCTNSPPPDPPCRLRATLPLTVFGVSSTTFTVPAVSWGALATLLVAIAWLARRAGARA